MNPRNLLLSLILLASCFETQAQAVRMSFPGHSSTIWTLTVDPTGHFLASGADNGEVKIWNLANAHLVKTIPAQSGSVWALAYTPSGSRLFTGGGGDFTARAWNAQSGSREHVFFGHELDVNCFAFSPDGRTLYTGAMDQTVRVWDVEGKRHLRTMTGHTSSVNSLSVSPDGKKLASVGGDGNLIVWDTQTGQKVKQIAAHTELASTVHFGPSYVATASWDGTVKFWSTANWSCVGTLRHSLPVHGMSVSPDGKWMACNYMDLTSGRSSIRFWELAKGSMVMGLTIEASGVNYMVFGPDGKSIFGVNQEQKISAWDVSVLARL